MKVWIQMRWVGWTIDVILSLGGERECSKSGNFVQELGDGSGILSPMLRVNSLSFVCSFRVRGSTRGARLDISEMTFEDHPLDGDP